MRHHFCFCQISIDIGMIYYISGNRDTQSEIEGQQYFSDDELKSISPIKQIAKGGFASVYLCKSQSNNIEMAMKRVDTRFEHKKLQQEVDSLDREIRIYRRLKHKNVVMYYGMLKDRDSVSIFMEYAKRGTIRDLIVNEGSLPEKYIGKFSGQILQGLKYLHGEHVVHRDLKCANVLLDEYNNCKLADFGLSKYADDISSTAGCKTDCGTIYWMSPESLSTQKYGNRSDIWSFGCTVFEMLTTKPPYGNLRILEAANKIVNEGFVPCFPCDSSDHCKVFVTKCFQKDDSLRPSAEELLADQFISVCDGP